MILVEAVPGPTMADQAVEVVERKGRGHPDSICDAVSDAVSVALCREYRRRFGAILHHNIDKSLLAAGAVRIGFGGGEVLRPMELILGDRATFRAGDSAVPVEEIAVETARRWFRENLRFVDPEKHLVCRSVLAAGSAELTDLFSRTTGPLPANDTSAAVGFYPLSPTERVVLALERRLNSPEFKGTFPETGEDVKVMGMRVGRGLDLTVAVPLLARFVKSEADYFACKGRVRDALDAFVSERREPGFDDVRLHLNALDQGGRGIHGVYLSLLGTSAEEGDSGQVGRGNRVNGLISVGRPLGTEAAAGKNPVSHVGKIYNVLAHRLAREICEGVGGVREAYVLLLSRIGTPIDQPQVASVRLSLSPGAGVPDVEHPIRELVEGGLQRIGRLCDELADGLHPIC